MQRPHVPFIARLCLVFGLAACEGPMGPAGAPGPGTRQVLNGTANGNGVATVALPAEAGDLTNPPVVACYISSDGSSWIIIAFDIDTDTDVDTNTDVAGFLGCFLDPGAANNISVVAEGVPPGWLLRVVIVY